MRYVPILPSAYSQKFLYDAFVVPQRQWDHRTLFCTFMHWKQDILPRPATRVIRAGTARPVGFQQEYTGTYSQSLCDSAPQTKA
jgi:hypothetical protein